MARRSAKNGKEKSQWQRTNERQSRRTLCSLSIVTISLFINLGRMTGNELISVAYLSVVVASFMESLR